MDRGIPTEEILREMRDPAREIFYLVGTPKGKIQQYEKKWLDLPWQQVRVSVDVKLFEQDGELYVLAKSEGRRAKETAMRRKLLARLLKKLRGPSGQRQSDFVSFAGGKGEHGSCAVSRAAGRPAEVLRHGSGIRVDRTAGDGAHDQHIYIKDAGNLPKTSWA
jgi:hypothetical protein